MKPKRIAVVMHESEIGVLMHALAHVNANERSAAMDWLGNRFAQIHKQIVVDREASVPGTHGPLAWTVNQGASTIREY